MSSRAASGTDRCVSRRKPNIIYERREGVIVCNWEGCEGARDGERSPSRVNQGVKTDTFTYHPFESLQDSSVGAFASSFDVAAANSSVYSQIE